MKAETYLAEARRLLAEDPVNAERLEQVCDEIYGGIVGGEMLIGLLPIDAPEVMARGYAAAALAGRAGSWTRLGRTFRDQVVDIAVDWPSEYPFPDAADEPAGPALRCFAEAARGGDRMGALMFAGASRRGSVQAQEFALTLLGPYLTDDPTGEVLMWCSHVNFARGDYASAVAASERAAALGNADAMFELYVFHANGYGVPHSNEAAHEWLMRAAELGQARALYNVGAAHATGRGLPKDGAAAVRYYERAAQAGNGQAAATLGWMYLVGDLVAEDHAQAERWFSDAEEKGFDVDGWLDGLGLQRPV